MSKLTNQEIKNYKALLFDLDGTLLNSHQKIPPLALTQINRFRQHGYKIGICTGRQYAIIKPTILPFFDQDDIHIVSNGAHLISNDGHTIWKKSIPSQTSADIYQFVNNLGAQIYFCQGPKAYTNLMPDRKHNLGYQTELTPPDLKNWVTSLIEIEASLPEIVNYIENLKSQHLINYLKLRDVISGKFYLIVTADGVGKGRAAQIWAEQLCVDCAEIIAFGNGANDVELFKAVGHKIAMGNSEKILLPFGDEIIGNPDDDTIGHYLSGFDID